LENISPRLLFTASNEATLRKSLKNLNVVVPPRQQGRQTWHVEQYIISRLIKSIPRYRLPLPITLFKCEKPDFIIERHGKRISIELTEAVSEVEAKRNHIRAKLEESGAQLNPLQSVVLRIPDESVPKKSEVISSPDNPFKGYVGNSFEENWITAMLHFINKKLKKFSSYIRSDEQWLVIYDNWPGAVATRLSKVSHQLQQELGARGVYSTINNIFIVRSTEFLEIDCDSISIRPIKTPRLSAHAKRAAATPCVRKLKRQATQSQRVSRLAV